MGLLKLLPPPARPPHDPLWLSLNGRQGWREGSVESVAILKDESAITIESSDSPTEPLVDQAAYLTVALDSGIQRCQWHRIVLNAQIPAATSILIRTYTAEVALALDIIRSVPDADWDTHPVARNVDGEWDCLIRSEPGRFLWLRLDFVGTGRVSPKVFNIDVEFPRISLRRYLPAVFGENPETADFTDRFLSLFDTTFRQIESQIDNQARLFDPRSTPAGTAQGSDSDFLSWLGSWVGLTLDRRWSVERRREFLRRAPALYGARGTREGMWKLLLLYLGMEKEHQSEILSRCGSSSHGCEKSCSCESRPMRSWRPPPLILEHFQLRRWLFVGKGRVGEDAVLWGRNIVNRSQLGVGAQLGESQLKGAQDPSRDPFHVYASRFTVFVPASHGKTPQQRKMLDQLLKGESPAHTQYSVEYVEPRFRIGVQSMIGLDAVIGKYPEAGVTVGKSALGETSVLGEKQVVHNDGRQTSSMQIGNTLRVGSNTRLA